MLVHNLARLMEAKPLDGHYTGYASCPLIISSKEVILAEFGYDGKIMETFNANEGGKLPLSLVGTLLPEALKRRIFMQLKVHVFPRAYFSLYPRGLWFGPNGPFKPDVVKPADVVVHK